MDLTVFHLISLFFSLISLWVYIQAHIPVSCSTARGAGGLLGHSYCLPFIVLFIYLLTKGAASVLELISAWCWNACTWKRRLPVSYVGNFRKLWDSHNADVCMHWYHPHTWYTTHKERWREKKCTDCQRDRANSAALTLMSSLISSGADTPSGDGGSPPHARHAGATRRLQIVVSSSYDEYRSDLYVSIWAREPASSHHEDKILERMHGLVARCNSPDKKLFALPVWWNNLADGSSPMLRGISVVGSIV